VDLRFDVDANGILSVTAKDTATGQDQKITITASSGLGEAEIQRMVKEAVENQADDKVRREQVEHRNKLDKQDGGLVAGVLPRLEAEAHRIASTLYGAHDAGGSSQGPEPKPPATGGERGRPSVVDAEFEEMHPGGPCYVDAPRTFCTSVQSVRAAAITEKPWRLTRPWHEAS
jgi:molecular chaperone DnaK